MSPLNTITLLINGLTLAIALGFLLIVLWHDARKELNQFFAIFLFLVTFWNIGSLMSLAASLIDVKALLIPLAVAFMELGFTGSSIAVYALTAVLVGVHARRFRLLAFAGLGLVLAYQIFLIVTNTPIPFEALGDGFFKYRFQPLSAVFYLTFDGTTLYLIWRYRRKIRSFGLMLGLNLFVIGQSLGFLNPELRVVSFSINLSSLAALSISFALLRQEIIKPLAERITQVEAVHKVSLAITSQIAIDTVLNQIAIQAAGWLNADAAGIFLNKGSELELATVYNLPASYLHSKIPLGNGVVGTVAQTRQSVHLENYGRDWDKMIDLPLARETFGSVMSVPLIYGNDAIGVLMVIAGRQGRLFQKEDVQLLELLGAQAAVAITHSHLFAEQSELTRQVEAAHNQLETVLSSTENPVVAIDRKFEIIFANPAARLLFNLSSEANSKTITELLPKSILPSDYYEVLRNLRQNRAHIYEISLGGKVYMCHLAQLGRPRAAGWVAVLNDITQLKELDRLKSEMVRMTSHDLKNPLQAAMANLELLSDDLADNENPEIQDSIATIGKQLQRMNRIISGILDLERVKSGSISMELCHPAEVIENAIEELHHLADDQSVSLTSIIADDLPEFWADTEQMKRALTNLVENAIKFTPKGGHVELRGRQENDQIIFEVSDTGIGIPESLQAQVFERFLRGGQRGQQGAEHITGSGLGLSLVKTIVENHHGRVWLSSQVGEGTIFSISIPVASESKFA